MLNQITFTKSSLLVLFVVTCLSSVAQNTGQEPKSDEPSQNWLATIQSDLENQEYNVSYDDATQAYQSPNRVNNIRAHYKPGLLSLNNRVDSLGHNWELSVRTAGIYLNGSKMDEPQTSAQAKVDNNTIEFAHSNFTEQYINTKEGVRQNYIIHQAPAGSHTVTVSLAVSGLKVNQVTDNELHLYQNVAGKKEVRLVYKDLKSWDANEKPLNGKIIYQDGEIKLRVETTKAIFPITIDPIYSLYKPILSTGQASAQMGYSVSSAGDVNDDGYSDVIVGAYLYDNGQTDEGAAFVYLGSSTGLSTTISSKLQSNQANAYMGWSVSSAGDVNNDGYDDVIVGAFYYDNGQTNEGAAFVYHGSSTGISTTISTQLESNQANAYLGSSVSSAGDVNGDGYSDVIVGVFKYDNGQTDEGAAFVYHGSSTGISTTISSQLECNQASAQMGRSVSTAGDVNNDGYSDVIVGAYLYDNGQTNEGAAFVYHGSSTGISTTISSQLESNQYDAQMGKSVSTAGDVNGDGYSDVIVGAYKYDNGQADEGVVFVYHGSSTGLSTTASSLLECNQVNAFFGVSVSTAGDVNGDGYSDVIVGADYYDNGQTNEGAVFVYHGSSTGLSTTASIQIESNQASARMGYSVSSAGDVNGDGYSDVIVGAPKYNNGKTNEGSAFVYYGSTTGVRNTSNGRLERNQANAEMGYSVSSAGDVNGDGYSDVIVGAPNFDSGLAYEGAAFVYHGSSTGLSTTVNSQIDGNQWSALLGWSVSSAGDANGDGYGDVIIGAKAYDYGQSNEGIAFVYYGSASGVITTTMSWLEGNQANLYMGESVSSAGDVNGDGYSDVIVGATGYKGTEGAAFVYYGSATGVNINTADTLESNQSNAYFGHSVSSAGDINGDGYSDVIVGALYYDNVQTNEGAAFVFYGSATGIDMTAADTFNSNQAGARMGVSVSSAGDVNGDGYSDVIVGASYFDNGQSNEGAAFVYHGSATGVNTTAADTLESNQAGAQMGISVSSAGDVNGDGYSDVIVGAHGYDNSQSNEGAAFVYLGSATGLSSTFSSQLMCNQANAQMGWSVSSAGDVNGDGFSDVIVGAKYFDNGQTDEGAAFVFHGSATGLSTTAVDSIESNQVSANMGWSVSSAGDVNGDGFSDVIVGARSYDNGQSNEGAAFVYHGSSTGLSTTISSQLESNQANAYLGYSVSSAGDVNGDGYSDVIVGAYLYDNGQTNEGAAFVYHGSSTGISTTASSQLECNQANAYMGISVSTAGDVNGDGFSDVIVGAHLYDNGQSNEGAAFVYHGSFTGLGATASSQLECNQANAYLGSSVSSAGDVNGDGYSDVIIGAPKYDNGQTDEGAAFVYHGSSTGLSMTASSRLEGNQASAEMGKSVSTAGDVNGDGYSDVIVGALYYDNGQTDEGAAFVYHGSSTGLSTTAEDTVESNQANAEMGYSVSSAGDVNGDGYSDVIVGAPKYDNGQTNEGAAFVYYGNNGGGMRNNLNLYDDNLSSLFTDTSFADANMGIGLFAKSPQGRQKGKIVYETLGVGDTFSSASPITNSTQFTGQASTYTDLGIAGTELKLAIAKENGPTRVRARVKYDPTTAINGQVYGPWKYLLINPQVSSIGAVPIELTYFTVTKRNDYFALLEWQTASELNNEKFEIERKILGTSDFEKIGEVAGAGNSQQLRTYNFSDDISELSGRICYRIKQVDYDNASEYSEIECISKVNDTEVLIYPNPTKGVLNIDLSDQEEILTIQVFSLNGHLVMEEQIHSSKTLDLSKLATGMYIMKGFSDRQMIFAQKLVVQH
ncbi:MAG: hypothetical protein COA58_10475 [Bacteroidetes bacterium]|nr:MAG: hypothetical protein COA58_10475 [Bacteroidota bacterium]